MSRAARSHLFGVTRLGNANTEILNVQIDGVGVDQTIKYDKEATGAAYQIAEINTQLKALNIVAMN